MNRTQTIAEIIDGEPGTFVYDAPFLGLEVPAEEASQDKKKASTAKPAEKQDR